MNKELITEAADSTKPQLAIVTRIFPHRRSKHAQGAGSASKLRFNSKVTRVSWTKMYTPRKGSSHKRRIEVEVLAKFQGPTGEDAAREFVKLYQQGRTSHAGIYCKADGPPPVPPAPWREGRATFHLIA